eukprot:7025568-Prorocentrum_lima.AAC.1
MVVGVAEVAGYSRLCLVTGGGAVAPFGGAGAARVVRGIALALVVCEHALAQRRRTLKEATPS